MEDEATALWVCEGETCGSGMVGVRALPQVELVTWIGVIKSESQKRFYIWDTMKCDFNSFDLLILILKPSAEFQVSADQYSLTYFVAWTHYLVKVHPTSYSISQLQPTQ